MVTFGFLPFVAKLIQSEETTGAKATMNNGLTDWNHEVGISQPKTTRSIKRSVYKLREEPACSKPAQKKITKTVSTRITAIRSVSSLESTFFGAAFCSAVCATNLPMLPK